MYKRLRIDLKLSAAMWYSSEYILHNLSFYPLYIYKVRLFYLIYVI